MSSRERELREFLIHCCDNSKKALEQSLKTFSACFSNLEDYTYNVEKCPNCGLNGGAVKLAADPVFAEYCHFLKDTSNSMPAILCSNWHNFSGKDFRIFESVSSGSFQLGDQVFLSDVLECISKHVTFVQDLTDPAVCTCPREIWLYQGCQCGAMRK